MNCELNHVDVVLCCDPKAFTHTNPLEGLNKGGCLVWESSESPETAWQRIPAKYRQFDSARTTSAFSSCPASTSRAKATTQTDLQLRMQGNSFLGAFFRVSPFLKTFGITEETIPRRSSTSSTRRSSAASATPSSTSNMKVMTEGFSRVQEIKYGEVDDPDRSSMRNPPLAPLGEHADHPDRGLQRCRAAGAFRCPAQQAAADAVPDAGEVRFANSAAASAITSPPARSPRSASWAPAPAPRQSKYVARRETPVYIAENCTQCMECITACPDTALPNTAQDVATVLKTAVNNYVTDAAERQKLGRRTRRPRRPRPRRR